MVKQRESFWSVVYPDFMARDLTRSDLRFIVRRGLQETSGSYKMLVELLNMKPTDYKRFLNFLRSIECHVPFERFRSASVGDPPPCARGGRVPEAVALSTRRRSRRLPGADHCQDVKVVS